MTVRSVENVLTLVVQNDRELSTSDIHRIVQLVRSELGIATVWVEDPELPPERPAVPSPSPDKSSTAPS